MRFTLLVAILFTISAGMLGDLRHIRAAAKAPFGASDQASPTPILLELFTSEGCSSCPPADALLERLDRSQPVHGAELIVLSEHVDYWNDIGWKDPYSSHEYSERQSAYAAQFGNRGIYTPQMVVDGHFEFVGSDEREATKAIEDAATAPKVPVTISSNFSDGRTLTLHVETGSLPLSVPAESVSVFLAMADNSDESHVSRGENAGRTLKHVAVVRSLLRIGAVDKDTGFSRDMRFDLKAKNPRDLRMVVIVQEENAGRVWGAGLARFSN